MTDPVNHPPHYTRHPSGVECIELTRSMDFCVGNAVKYLFRHGQKNGLEDLEKALWYLEDAQKVFGPNSWRPLPECELVRKFLAAEPVGPLWSVYAIIFCESGSLMGLREAEALLRVEIGRREAKAEPKKESP